MNQYNGHCYLYLAIEPVLPPSFQLRAIQKFLDHLLLLGSVCRQCLVDPGSASSIDLTYFLRLCSVCECLSQSQSSPLLCSIGRTDNLVLTSSIALDDHLDYFLACHWHCHRPLHRYLQDCLCFCAACRTTVTRQVSKSFVS